MPLSSAVSRPPLVPEAILWVVGLTPTEMPIDLIIHTPGELVQAAEQIAHALLRHQAPATIFVPHYAMSEWRGGLHRRRDVAART
jgi:hypothetical protein